MRCRAALLVSLSILAAAAPRMSDAQTIVKVFAAGSLRSSLTEIAQAFRAETTLVSVEFVFGASGLLKDRLLAGEQASLFASANMDHPHALLDAGRAVSVARFTRNRLCVLARPGLALSTDTVVQRMLDPEVKVGISTPKADPSGDYAFELFERVETSGSAAPGSAMKLKAKALQLTGGPLSPTPPVGQNVYAAMLTEGQADLFITYCTNAVSARQEKAGLQIVDVPAQINVSATYGLAVLREADPVAQRFAAYLSGSTAQGILRRNGFAEP